MQTRPYQINGLKEISQPRLPCLPPDDDLHHKKTTLLFWSIVMENLTVQSIFCEQGKYAHTHTHARKHTHTHTHTHTHACT